MSNTKEIPSGWVGTPTQNEAKMNTRKLQTRVKIDHINPKSLNIDLKKNSCEGRSKTKESPLSECGIEGAI